MAGVRDVLAVEPAVHRSVAAPEHLGRNRVGVARPVQLLERRSHDLLRAPALIAFGVVEEVDAMIEGDAYEACRLIDVELLGEGDPGAKRELADLEASLAEAAVFHSDFRDARLEG